VRREWEPEDLVACWTLVEADWELLANKTKATRQKAWKGRVVSWYCIENDVVDDVDQVGLAVCISGGSRWPS
jgi:hypothetical protein